MRRFGSDSIPGWRGKSDTPRHPATSIDGQSILDQSTVLPEKYQDVSLQPDQDFKEAERFLTLLDEEAEIFTFQVADDLKTRKAPHLARQFHGSLAQHWDVLCHLNNQGAGVFVCVNETDGRRRKAENIIRIRAVWQEQDRPGCPELPVTPHVVVESSPGKHHRYVLIDDCPLEAFQGIQERLVESYGSDPDAKDIARVLRLPGLFHMKKPDRPHLVRIVAESGELPLPYEEARRIFPPVARAPKSAQPTNPSPLNGERIVEIRSAVNSLSPDISYQEWLNVGMGLHDEFGGSQAGLDLWESWSSTGASYRPGECAYKWATFKTGDGVTVQSIFKMASQTGWRWSAEDKVSINEATPHKTNSRRFSLIRISEIETKPADWLVQDFLTADSLGLFFSDPGGCKTFLGVSLSCSVASGESFHGRRVKQRPVVFIAGEGHSGLKKRFDAWSIRHQVNLDDAPLYISSVSASFLSPESMAEVVAAVDAITEEHGSPGLIIIDTVARNFGPGDENSTSDMGAFIQSADHLREKYKAAVLLIHHVGHADKTRARGAMALKGALDFEYRLERGDDDVIRVDCTKCKDFEPPAPMAFRLRPVELPLMDEHGNPVKSAVLDATEYKPPVRTTNAGRGKNQTKALETLHALFHHHRNNIAADGRDPAGARVTLDEWQLECKVIGKMPRNRFQEACRSLQEAGAVKVENGFVVFCKGVRNTVRNASEMSETAPSETSEYTYRYSDGRTPFRTLEFGGQQCN